jgi:hypothetical protein
MSKAFLVFGILVALLVGLVFGAQAYFESSTIQPKIDERKAEVEEYLEPFLADVKVLKAHPFFRAERSGKNAAAFMTDKVGWATVKESKLKLPEDLTKKLAGFPDQLKDEAALFEKIQALDFSWLEGIQQFGHWEFDGTGPYEEGKKVLPWTADLPNFIPLRNWARLYLLKASRAAPESPPSAGAQEVPEIPQPKKPDVILGEKKKEAGEGFGKAVADVRHLAFLCMSTETLIGEMIGVAMLKEVEKALAHWDSGQNEPLFTEADLERMKRSFFASSAFLSPYASAEIHQRVVKEADGFMGMCAGATEAAAWFLPLAPMLEERFEGHTQRLAQTLKKDISGCRQQLARRFMAQFTPESWTLRDALILLNETQGGGSNEPSDMPITWKLGMLIPGMPNLMGGILTEITMPAWFGDYRQKSAPPPKTP